MTAFPTQPLSGHRPQRRLGTPPPQALYPDTQPTCCLSHQAATSPPPQPPARPPPSPSRHPAAIRAVANAAGDKTSRRRRRGGTNSPLGHTPPLYPIHLRPPIHRATPQHFFQHCPLCPLESPDGCLPATATAAQRRRRRIEPAGLDSSPCDHETKKSPEHLERADPPTTRTKTTRRL